MKKETNKTWPAPMLNMGTDSITQLIPLVKLPVADVLQGVHVIWPVRAWEKSWRYKHF
jgi:hypothetical protein